VKNVFGPVIFQGCFPVAKCFEGYSVDPWIFQFFRDASSLQAEVVTEMLFLDAAKYLFRGSQTERKRLAGCFRNLRFLS
jgi:hypothetical protein